MEDLVRRRPDALTLERPGALVDLFERGELSMPSLLDGTMGGSLTDALPGAAGGGLLDSLAPLTSDQSPELLDEAALGSPDASFSEGHAGHTGHNLAELESGPGAAVEHQRTVEHDTERGAQDEQPHDEQDAALSDELEGEAERTEVTALESRADGAPGGAAGDVPGGTPGGAAGSTAGSGLAATDPNQAALASVPGGAAGAGGAAGGPGGSGGAAAGGGGSASGAAASAGGGAPGAAATTAAGGEGAGSAGGSGGASATSAAPQNALDAPALGGAQGAADAAGGAGEGGDLASMQTGDVALIDEELAEHQRWAGASARVGDAGSTQRASFVCEAAGGGLLNGFAQGAAEGLKWGLIGRAATHFIPIPGVGQLIGGYQAISGLAERNWEQTAGTIGKFGEGSGTYEVLANSIASIAEIIDVATNIMNAIAGVIGMISTALWVVAAAATAAAFLTFGATAGIAIAAGELAATLGEVATGISAVSNVLGIINSLILQPCVMLFRAMHSFTTEADPRDVEAQGAGITQAASAAGGQLGGMAGGALADVGSGGGARGEDDGEPPRPGAAEAPEGTTAPAAGDGPTVHFEEPPLDLPSTAPAPDVDPLTPTVSAASPDGVPMGNTVAAPVLDVDPVVTVSPASDVDPTTPAASGSPIEQLSFAGFDDTPNASAATTPAPDAPSAAKTSDRPPLEPDIVLPIEYPSADVGPTDPGYVTRHRQQEPRGSTQISEHVMPGAQMEMLSTPPATAADPNPQPIYESQDSRYYDNDYTTRVETDVANTKTHQAGTGDNARTRALQAQVDNGGGLNVIDDIYLPSIQQTADSIAANPGSQVTEGQAVYSATMQLGHQFDMGNGDVSYREPNPNRPNRDRFADQQGVRDLAAPHGGTVGFDDVDWNGTFNQPDPQLAALPPGTQLDLFGQHQTPQPATPEQLSLALGQPSNPNQLSLDFDGQPRAPGGPPPASNMANSGGTRSGPAGPSQALDVDSHTSPQPAPGPAGAPAPAPDPSPMPAAPATAVGPDINRLADQVEARGRAIRADDIRANARGIEIAQITEDVQGGIRRPTTEMLEGDIGRDRLVDLADGEIGQLEAGVEVNHKTQLSEAPEWGEHPDNLEGLERRAHRVGFHGNNFVEQRGGAPADAAFDEHPGFQSVPKRGEPAMYPDEIQRVADQEAVRQFQELEDYRDSVREREVPTFDDDRPRKGRGGPRLSEAERAAREQQALDRSILAQLERQAAADSGRYGDAVAQVRERMNRAVQPPGTQLDLFGEHQQTQASAPVQRSSPVSEPTDSRQLSLDFDRPQALPGGGGAAPSSGPAGAGPAPAGEAGGGDTPALFSPSTLLAHQAGRDAGRAVGTELAQDGQDGSQAALGPQAQLVQPGQAGAAGQQPGVARVNPAYPEPPGTPEQLTAIQDEITNLLGARAQSEQAEAAMTAQEQVHQVNQGHAQEALQTTAGALTASQAHQQSIARRNQANQQQQQRRQESESLVSGYPSRAAGLAAVRIPLAAFRGFLYIATELPGAAGAAMQEMASDADGMEEAFTQMDLSMDQQAQAQPARAEELQGDQLRIESTDQQAVASEETLHQAEEGAQAFQQENDSRLQQATQAREEAAQQGSEIDEAVVLKQEQAQTFEQELQAWSGAHQAARQAAIEEARAQVETQGYVVGEVQEG